MSAISFKIKNRLTNGWGRAGVIETPHGLIHTPGFTVVGTQATVKSLTPTQLKELGAEVVLANTYHLYLNPGPELVAQSGGLGKFMNWDGPTITDSGGFQAFSLGAAFGKGISKVTTEAQENSHRFTHPLVGSDTSENFPGLVRITDDGVKFRSHLDGSEHFFTPEKSIEIQHQLGADIIFAFDECTSPLASYEYQQQALGRTHAWAQRCLEAHEKLPSTMPQALFGIVQGGRFQDLREASARAISNLDFEGFGIGGSFSKDDIQTAVGWATKILPEAKPRHLLGIGEPEDIFKAVAVGIDTFDCVIPTRLARHGTIFTKQGKVAITKSQFRTDLTPLESNCACYTCSHFTRAYIAHLFRAKEILAITLMSIHNVYFIVHLVRQIRESILDNYFDQLRDDFLANYKN